MARTGQDQAQQNFNTDTAEQKQTFNTSQQAIGQTQSNLAKLQSGRQVAANPWMNPNYLASVNRATAGSLDASNDAGAAALRMNNRRTGGMNNTSTEGSISDLAQQKMRLSDQLNAERQGQDWNKNVQYQQQAATAPLAIAGAQNPYYSGSTGGSTSAAGDLTQFGLADENLIASAIQGAGSAAAACPAEGSLYLMADGSEKPVEQLKVDDWSLSIEGHPEPITKIDSVVLPILSVVTEDGQRFRNSHTHCFVMSGDGFTLAAESLGKEIITKFGTSKIVSVEEAGTARVFSIETPSCTYRADGAWAYAVGHKASDDACERYLAAELEVTCVR